MSGRGLGFTGGTLDKMESIPGYRTDLTEEEFLAQLRKEGLVLTGQTGDLAPADGKLYSLRDVTGTVQSIPLIASSIMSKKIAAGAQAIVLDVKAGNGAFLNTVRGARVLAETMVWIAKLLERQAIALISDMNQPLGLAVGNALEVKEAIQTLQGGCPADFLEHCLVVAGHLLTLGGLTADEKQGESLARQVLRDGRAWECFRSLVQAQGGDVRYVDQPELLPKSSLVEDLLAPASGYLSEINALAVGESVVLLGGGRSKKGDPIDRSVGVMVHHKVGDWVDAGEPLLTIHANRESSLDEARRRLEGSIALKDEPVKPLPLFYDVVRWDEAPDGADDQVVEQA